MLKKEKQPKSEEQILRTQIRRWHGSITREDRNTFVVLLSSEFNWFYWKVKSRVGDENMDFLDCVEKANIEELRKFFRCIDEYRIEQRWNKSK